MPEQKRTEDAPQATSEEDKVLTQRVYRALEAVEALRVLDPPLEVKAQEGVVTLAGVVSTHAIRVQARETARTVPGVRQVRDQLRTNSDLEVQIAQALSDDPRTGEAAEDIIVNVVQGGVSLVGWVPTQEIAQAAEAIAAAVPGVYRVTNRLTVAPRGKGEIDFNE